MIDTIKKYFIHFACLANFLLMAVFVFGQPNTTVDLDKDKPKQYENRKLVSEKTGLKQFNYSRRLYQNTVTHYNYFFNAANKLNDIIERAKLSFKEDYTKLLPFYNYSLDVTALDKKNLDSLIYKCNAGIFLHDLRDDWIDDLYLLLGRAYLLRKDFDSAAHVFQYINYAWAPKDDGYDIPIGSNASNTNGVFTIATNEDKALLKKISSKPPSRNESFIWQIRNYLEQNKITEATSLLSILRSDPNFPKRLNTSLNEMTAYAFYKQQIYDSAAFYLQKSLDNAGGILAAERWEFLCGQMYKASMKSTAAINMFERSTRHTIDPFMEVYARLNIVNLASSLNKENVTQQNLNELYKLASRSKYENYRDIIYYAAALLRIQQKNTVAAINDLSRSIKFSIDNPEQKQKSFLLLADLNYEAKKYVEAYRSYDSVKTNYLSVPDIEKVDLRKPALKKITENLIKIHLQDSLLILSSMTELDRVAAVKKIYRQLRKAQGLKDSTSSYFDNNLIAQNNGSLFSTATSDFYFSNAAIKTQGVKDFKSLWGNRPNVDNWRRQSVVSSAAVANTNMLAIDVDQLPTEKQKENSNNNFTFEGLLLNIPVTKQKIDLANKQIATALYENAETFENKLEDYPSALGSFLELLRRYPDFTFAEKATFNLAYCYQKMGGITQFDSLKAVLNKKYADGVWTYKINKGEFLNLNDSTVTVTSFTKEYIAKQYEQIYNLFIEGKFEEAKKEKLIADNQFGKSYWTPQLLFIEAVYYVKQHQDSIAISRLDSLIKKFPKSLLTPKSTTMVDVLKRRKEIESYLTNLVVEKSEDETIKRVDLYSANVVRKVNEPQKRDTITKVMAKPVLELKKIEIKPILTSPLINDSVFSFEASDKHYVAIVFDHVDEVYSSEARNAFARFNREKYYNQNIDISSIKLNTQYNILLLGPFASAGESVNYLDITKPIAASRIIPWLSANKYKFIIISDRNLDSIKKTKDISSYIKFIKDLFPDKFQ